MITRRRAIDLVRREQLRATPSLDESESTEPASDLVVADVPERAETRDEAKRALARLPDDQLPKLAGTAKLTVYGTGFAGAGIDNPPSGTSQGDEQVVTAQFLTAATGGKNTGRFEIHEILTDGGTPTLRWCRSPTALPGGQISAVGIQPANQQGARLAVVGGTGQYYNVRGGNSPPAPGQTAPCD